MRFSLASDSDALAAALNRLRRDLELRARFGEAGRRRVEREFDATTMVARVADLYRQVLREGQPH